MTRLSSIATRSLTIRYTIALIAIATTCLASQMVVQSLLAKAQSHSHLVNVAGRQRMLSQRIAKVVHRLASVPSPEDSAGLLAELNESVNDIESVHRAIRAGDTSQNLPGLRNAGSLELLDAVSPHLDSMTQTARRVLAIHESGADAGMLRSLADEIAISEQAFLRDMDKVVFSIAEDAKREIDQLIWFERMITLATVIMLALEALFVFRPAVARIGVAIDHLRVALSQARSASRVAEQAIGERNIALSAAAIDLKRLSQEIDSLLLDQMMVSSSRDTKCFRNLMTHVQGTLGKLSDLVEDDSQSEQTPKVSRTSPRTLVRNAVHEFQRNNNNADGLNISVTMDQRLPASLLVDEQMFLSSIVYMLQGVWELVQAPMNVHVGYDDRTLQLVVQVKVERELSFSADRLGDLRSTSKVSEAIRLECESLDLLLAKRTVERLGGSVHATEALDHVSIFLPLDENKRMTLFADDFGVPSR